MHRTILAFACAGIVATLAACGDDNGTGPSTAAVAGAYEATEFTTTEGGVTTDRLAQGASVHLELHEDGTAAGRLFIPGGDEGGGDLDESLSGTWSLHGNTVTLAAAGDPFLEDVPLAFEPPDRLRADAAFGGIGVHVVLEK
jgi:hypothetical protein